MLPRSQPLRELPGAGHHHHARIGAQHPVQHAPAVVVEVALEAVDQQQRRGAVHRAGECETGPVRAVQRLAAAAQRGATPAGEGVDVQPHQVQHLLVVGGVEVGASVVQRPAHGAALEHGAGGGMAHQAPHPLRAERAQVLPVDPHGVRRGELGAGGELQHPAQQLLRGARILGDQAHPVPGPGHERGVARGETRQVQVHQRVPGLDRTRRLDLGGEPTALLGAAAALLGAGQRRAQHHPGREMGLPVLDDPPDLEHRRGGDPGDGHRRHGHARGLAQVDPGRGDQQRGQGRGDHAAGAEGADGLGAVHRDLHQAPGGLAQVAQLPLRPARGEDPLGGGDGVGDAGGEAAAGAAHASGLDQRGPCPHQQAQPEHHQRNRHRDGEQRMQHDEGSQAAQDQRHPDGQRGDALGDPVAHPGEVVGGAGDGHAE